MRTIRTKVYQFEELSAEAKQAAITEYKEDMHYWLDPFEDDAKETIQEAGFTNVEIHYSLGHNQGDGFSFDADIDILKIFPNNRVAKLINNGHLLNFTIEKNDYANHYSHARTRYVDLNFSEGHKNIDEELEKMAMYLEALRMSLCNKLERQGYEDIAGQESDDYISEILTINEYEFTKEGKQFYA